MSTQDSVMEGELERYLGNTIRELRRAHGLTIADISERADISRGMLSRIENGQTATSLDALSRIARALGVSLSALFKNYETEGGGAQLIKAGESMEVARRGTRSGHTYHLLSYHQDPTKLFEPWRRSSYRRVLGHASLTLGDGIGLKIGGKLLGRPIRQNVNRTDLFPRLCELADRRRARIFLLGARREVVRSVGDWIEARYQGAVVSGAHHGYFDAVSEPVVVEQIRASKPDILLVALGAPRQDEWLAAHLAATGATVGIGVGGLFDFYSGRIPRAPVWMRELGLEWVFRLYQEPRRMWRRYLVVPAMSATVNRYR